MEVKANEAKQIGNVSFSIVLNKMASCRLSNLKFASNMRGRMGKVASVACEPFF